MMANHCCAERRGVRALMFTSLVAVELVSVGLETQAINMRSTDCLRPSTVWRSTSKKLSRYRSLDMLNGMGVSADVIPRLFAAVLLRH